MICQQCFRPLTKPWQKKFCSSSCSSTFNNKVIPRMRPFPNKFCSCGGRKSGRAKTCSLCVREKRGLRILKDVISKYKGSLKWNTVRAEARLSMTRRGVEKKCTVCGWNKHVEVAHIKSISLFPVSTKITEVNAENNIIYLCPNCHWLHDNQF